MQAILPLKRRRNEKGSVLKKAKTAYRKAIKGPTFDKKSKGA
jgi:hypothetical protein